jgi:cold shock CspA family protein
VRFWARVVSWDARGFGFLRVFGDDVRGSVFTHVTQLPAGCRSLRPGQRVTFVWVSSPIHQRPMAGDVQIVEPGTRACA